MSKEDGLVPIRKAAAIAVPPIRGVLQCLPAADRRIGDPEGPCGREVSRHVGDQRIIRIVDDHRVRLEADAVVIYNADDPLVADVARDFPAARTFGIADSTVRRGEALEHAADGRYCYRCGLPYRYEAVFLGHLGAYRCDSCGTARPLLAVAADNVRLRGITGSVFTLTTPVGRADVTTTLPGLYNVYNIVAAATAALTPGTTLGLVRTVVRDFIPAFGRVPK